MSRLLMKFSLFYRVRRTWYNMLDAFSKALLNRRPKIQFVGPRSVDTIPEPSPSVSELKKTERVQQLISGLKNLNIAAELTEDLIAKRAKDVTLALNLDDPEDFATAQAAARCFPDQAQEIPNLPGIKVVTEITFLMYRNCMTEMKNHGKTVGQQNQIPSASIGPKTNFGGLGLDRRPQVNSMGMVMPPISIPAFMIAAIPLLFLMTHPLRQAYVNSKIIGHTHPVVIPPVLVPIPSGPGIPVLPI